MPNRGVMKLELSLDEINTITAALGEVPMKVGLPVFMKIKEQVEPQLSKQELAPVPVPTTE